MTLSRRSRIKTALRRSISARSLMRRRATCSRRPRSSNRSPSGFRIPRFGTTRCSPRRTSFSRAGRTRPPPKNSRTWRDGPSRPDVIAEAELRHAACVYLDRRQEEGAELLRGITATRRGIGCRRPRPASSRRGALRSVALRRGDSRVQQGAHGLLRARARGERPVPRRAVSRRARPVHRGDERVSARRVRLPPVAAVSRRRRTSPASGFSTRTGRRPRCRISSSFSTGTRETRARARSFSRRPSTRSSSKRRSVSSSFRITAPGDMGQLSRRAASHAAEDAAERVVVAGVRASHRRRRARRPGPLRRIPEGARDRSCASSPGTTSRSPRTGSSRGPTPARGTTNWPYKRKSGCSPLTRETATARA